MLPCLGRQGQQTTFLHRHIIEWRMRWNEKNSSKLRVCQTRRSWKTHKLQEFVKSTLSNCIAKSTLWSNHYQIAKSTSPCGLPCDLHAAHKLNSFGLTSAWVCFCWNFRKNPLPLNFNNLLSTGCLRLPPPSPSQISSTKLHPLKIHKWRVMDFHL
jgi:hypothetical protein